MEVHKTGSALNGLLQPVGTAEMAAIKIIKIFIMKSVYELTGACVITLSEMTEAGHHSGR